MTTDSRDAHPYHMRDAILAQPEAFVRVVERGRDAVDDPRFAGVDVSGLL